MSIEITLYLLGLFTKIDTAISLCCLASVLCTLGMLVAFAVTTEPWETEIHLKIKSKLKPLIIFTVVSTLLGIAFPSEKTIYMIAAVHMAKGSDIPKKLLNSIEIKLDEYIMEIKNKTGALK